MFGRESQKVVTNTEAITRIAMQLGAHELSKGHTETLISLAANDEKVRQIKEDTEEIKDDLKTLIKTIQQDRERRN